MGDPETQLDEGRGAGPYEESAEEPDGDAPAWVGDVGGNEGGDGEDAGADLEADDEGYAVEAGELWCCGGGLGRFEVDQGWHWRVEGVVVRG